MSDETVKDSAAGGPLALPTDHESAASRVWYANRGDGPGRMIYVEGNFGYALYADFREAYRDLQAGVPVDVDLQGAEDIDSAALGILMMLNEHVGNDNRRTRVYVRPGSIVERVLDTAGFAKRFSILRQMRPDDE